MTIVHGQDDFGRMALAKKRISRASDDATDPSRPHDARGPFGDG